MAAGPEDRPLLQAAADGDGVGGRTGKRTSMLGVASLAVLIAAWVGQSEVSKFLQEGAGAAYNAPYFITVLNQSMMVLAVPLNLFLLPRRDVFFPGAYLSKFGLSVRAIALHSTYLAIVYCASTYFWFGSLGRKSVNVAIASGLYNSSVVWVFLLSLACGMEKFSALKAVGVATALAGVSAGSISTASAAASSNVSSSPSPSPFSHLRSAGNSPLHQSFNIQIGYVEVVGSAMLYAVFEVLLNRVTNRAVAKHAEGGVVPDVPLAVANFFTAGVGFVHLFFLSLMLWPMDALGIEPFVWPTPEQWGLLWINAGLGTLFNISFCAALVLMSPLLVSISCLLTIPLAACVDLIRGQADFTGLQIVGMFLICAGFLCFLGICQQKRDEKGADTAGGERTHS
eukprot:g1927.t1